MLVWLNKKEEAGMGPVTAQAGYVIEKRTEKHSSKGKEGKLLAFMF